MVIFFWFIFLQFYIQISFLFVFQNELCCLFILKTLNFCFFSSFCIFFCPLHESCSYLVFLFDPPTIFRTQMIRNHDLPRWVFSNNQKRNLPCLWYTLVTPPLHGLLLTVYTLQWNWEGQQCILWFYYNIVSNVWSFPKDTPPLLSIDKFLSDFNQVSL